MKRSQVFTNARVVLRDQVLPRGQVQVRDGLIQDIGSGNGSASSALAGAIDLQGDWLLPGLVEIHTDNLERHVTPRPKVSFPMSGAVQSHDAEMAAAGITTVFDAIGVGDPYADGFRANDQSGLLQALDRLEAAGALRVDHLIHVRCELPAGNAQALFEPFAGHPRLRLMSLMDHTPGQRQWTDIEQARTFYTGKKGWSDAQFDDQVRQSAERQIRHAAPNRRWFSDFAVQSDIVLATHDDTTEAHVDEAMSLGASISEFPTTLAAAQRAKALGLSTFAGAPNVVRGRSHSGNVSALDLARAGCLDGLSSDYVPSSLLQAAWGLMREAGHSAAEAVAVVSHRPAQACRLRDRGEIAIGLRADLVRVRELDGVPLVREVWRGGQRVS